MIFALFLEDIESDKKAGAKNTVLIGSPGVGKSILFFLAALYQAQRRPIVYHRITKTEDEKASLFFVAPQGDGKVRVWFTRNMDEEAIKDISSLRFDVERALNIRREDYYVYIDGPNQVDENYLMNGRYDYFARREGLVATRKQSGENDCGSWMAGRARRRLTDLRLLATKSQKRRKSTGFAAATSATCSRLAYRWSSFVRSSI